MRNKNQQEEIFHKKMHTVLGKWTDNEPLSWWGKHRVKAQWGDMILCPESSRAACDIQYAVVSMEGVRASLDVWIWECTSFVIANIAYALGNIPQTHMYPPTPKDWRCQGHLPVSSLLRYAMFKRWVQFCAYQDGVAKTGLCLKKYFDTSHLSLSI